MDPQELREFFIEIFKNESYFRNILIKQITSGLFIYQLKPTKNTTKQHLICRVYEENGDIIIINLDKNHYDKPKNALNDNYDQYTITLAHPNSINKIKEVVISYCNIK